MPTSADDGMTVTLRSAYTVMLMKMALREGRFAS
jgi:hypothetical protein